MRTLSLKVLREALWLIEGLNGSTAIRVRAAIQACLKPKRSAAPAKKRRATKKATRKEKTAAVREAVVERAGGRCERCGQGPGLLSPPHSLDHFRGGAHKRSNETVEGCWLLCFECHRSKSDSSPTRLSWLGAFREHCLEHNYFREARETERLMDVCGTKAELSKAVGR